VGARKGTRTDAESLDRRRRLGRQSERILCDWLEVKSEQVGRKGLTPSRFRLMLYGHIVL